jgi:hypothetical protein
MCHPERSEGPASCDVREEARRNVLNLSPFDSDDQQLTYNLRDALQRIDGIEYHKTDSETPMNACHAFNAADASAFD